MNISGEDYEIGEAVVWDDVLSVTDADDFNPREALVDFVCEADRPTWHDSVASLGIVLDDTPDDDFGRVVIGGAAVVRLSDATDGAYAFIDPSTPERWKLSASSGYKVIDKINDDWAVVNLSSFQPLWRYELTQDSQAPSTATAKLIALDGTEFAASINLSDPLSTTTYRETGDKGYCILTGDKFEALVPAPKTLQVVTDFIVGESGITIERKNVTVFGTENVDDEVIEGTEC
ncbi:hypothetical protein Enr13x_42290 [Stieleria neptunia]|uniref:Uncharacterized protein n=1 Tax=Stieleria neptunia TaxID=2527979 RepID=A0A518HU69_9BACT|nr:hypothetical protein [Stieleria neptunia]QDV44364.1 hypothetical protein Enr13x_42290 [Stieleria neptunia]